MRSFVSPPFASDFNFSTSNPSTGITNFPKLQESPPDFPFKGTGNTSFGLSSSQHDDFDGHEGCCVIFAVVVEMTVFDCSAGILSTITLGGNVVFTIGCSIRFGGFTIGTIGLAGFAGTDGTDGGWNSLLGFLGIVTGFSFFTMTFVAGCPFGLLNSTPLHPSGKKYLIFLLCCSASLNSPTKEAFLLIQIF